MVMENQYFTLICIQNIVMDMVVSEFVEKWISCEKLQEKMQESWLRKWSWKIANFVLESQGKVMEFHFWGFVGTLTLRKGAAQAGQAPMIDPSHKYMYCSRSHAMSIKCRKHHGIDGIMKCLD